MSIISSKRKMKKWKRRKASRNPSVHLFPNCSTFCLLLSHIKFWVQRMNCCAENWRRMFSNVFVWLGNIKLLDFKCSKMKWYQVIFLCQHLTRLFNQFMNSDYFECFLNSIFYFLLRSLKMRKTLPHIDLRQKRYLFVFSFPWTWDLLGKVSLFGKITSMFDDSQRSVLVESHNKIIYLWNPDCLSYSSKYMKDLSNQIWPSLQKNVLLACRLRCVDWLHVVEGEPYIHTNPLEMCLPL